MSSAYFLVQPWGRKPGEHTLLGEFESRQAAFDALDAMAEKMAATGARPSAVEIVVVNAAGLRVPRLNAN